MLAAHPGAILVFIYGNHERRIRRFLNKFSPKIRKTVMRRFIEIVRAGGRVLYIGYTDRVRVGPLLVAHGWRTNIHAAKAQLEDLGAQVSVMSGHIHRLTYWAKNGEDYAVKSITSGCNVLDPHYAEGESQTNKWMLGTAIADVDMVSRLVEFTNLQYHLEDERLYTRLERRTFEAVVELPAIHNGYGIASPRIASGGRCWQRQNRT